MIEMRENLHYFELSPIKRRKGIEESSEEEREIEETKNDEDLVFYVPFHIIYSYIETIEGG